MKRLKPGILTKNIETISKKLNIFTLDDIEVLTEKPKIEILPVLEILVSKKRLKYENETYIYIPRTVQQKTQKAENKTESFIHSLPFRPDKPKKVFLKNINQLDGFVDYFFATKSIKDRIKRIFTTLKQAQGLKGEALYKILRENNMPFKSYLKYKKEIAQNGLVNLLSPYMQEPGEIFYFYKQYYLSPKKLCRDDARELAIQRFEKLIKMHLNRGKITSAETMDKWLKKEYTKEQIKKFREINYSEFDAENMYKE